MDGERSTNVTNFVHLNYLVLHFKILFQDVVPALNLVLLFRLSEMQISVSLFFNSVFTGVKLIQELLNVGCVMVCFIPNLREDKLKTICIVLVTVCKVFYVTGNAIEENMPIKESL